MQIHDDLLKLQNAASILDAFVLQYGDKLPDGLGCIHIGFGSSPVPTYSVYLTSKTDQDRLRALQLLGDVFGRHEWTAKPSYDNRAFDWKKSVAGVEIKIDGAETLPPLQPMPVPPSKFPIQLEDQRQEVAE